MQTILLNDANQAVVLNHRFIWNRSESWSSFITCVNTQFISNNLNLQ